MSDLFRTTVEPQTPGRLEALAGRLVATGSSAPAPRRSTAEVFDAIVAGQPVTALDWARLVRDRRWWAAGGVRVAKTLWKASGRQPAHAAQEVLHRAFVRHFCVPGFEYLRPLVDGAPADGMYDIIRRGDAHRLAKEALAHRRTPGEHLAAWGCVRLESLASRAASEVPGVFMLHPKEEWETPLLSCLDLLSEDAKRDVARRLIGEMEREHLDRLPRLVSWIYTWMNRLAADILPEDLAKIFAAFQYASFYRVVRQRTLSVYQLPHTATENEIEREISSRYASSDSRMHRARQLWRRADYWAAYSSCMQEIVLLVPTFEQSELTKLFGELPENIEFDREIQHMQVLFRIENRVFLETFGGDNPLRVFSAAPEDSLRRFRRPAEPPAWEHHHHQNWQPELDNILQNLGILPRRSAKWRTR